MQWSYKYLNSLSVLFVTLLIISNITATKLVNIGGLELDGAFLLFPVLYILGDIITEVYGFRHMRRIIWTGFLVMLLAVGYFFIVQLLPGSPSYQGQAAYEAVLGFLPRIVAASLAAYLVGEFINSYILAKLKIKFKGKKMWLRMLASTAVAALLDTIIFATIAFGGVLTGLSFLNYVIVGVVLKLLVEAACLPITYKVVATLKLKENSNVYDRKIDFNPFARN